MISLLLQQLLKGFTKKTAKCFALIDIRLLLKTGTCNNYHNIYFEIIMINNDYHIDTLIIKFL